MEENIKGHIALHAPNLVNICIDRYDGGEASGRIYHCYDEDAWSFSNVIQMVGLVETFFDSISFPQASTKARAFVKTKQPQKKEMSKIVTPQELISKRGELGTFLMHVKYRQNSSWQGEVEWLEGESRQQFVSVLEVLKILNNALEG
ncbi:MAG: hypothetical protein EOM40_19195 [Clostridia bacterium]|nr:hypothetical protein [Clostridia bacterium]